MNAPTEELPPPGLAALTDTLSDNNGRFSVSIPAGWRQGRTAYGGLTSALSLAAARKTHRALPPLRSFQTTFIGPVGKDAVMTPTILRQGKNVTSLNVDVHTDGHIAARTVFLFGAERQSELNVISKGPDAPAPQMCEFFTPEAARTMVPPFLQRFDVRLIEGGRPMSGSDSGYIRTWCRHDDPLSREGEISLVSLADVLPPAALPMFKKFGPVSSVNWQMNFLVPDPETADGWWQVETALTAARDGYSSQIMRLWNRDGELVAEGTQLVAIFM